MAITITDRSLIKAQSVKPEAVKPEAPRPDPHAELLTTLVNSQTNTDKILLFIGHQLNELKSPKPPVDVVAHIIRDDKDKITAIHITETKR